MLVAALGWHQGNMHWQLGGLLNVPIGSYSQNDLVNLGFNRWAFDLTGSATYLYIGREQALRFSQGSLGKYLMRISVPDHKMKWYLQGLKDKLDNSIRIDPRDREKHIVRHKAGTGVETAPTKKQFNFNRH